MNGKTASILGATGLIGSHLLDQLLEDPDFDVVRILVRRPVDRTHPKLEIKLVDFNVSESVKLALDGSDCLFSAIGTTQKKVRGNRAEYLKVDFDIPVKAVRLAKEVGIETFAFVSAVGANSKSGNFYLKLKGHVEDAIKLEGLRSVHAFQPAQLMGNRKESRPLEKVAQGVSWLLSPLLVGKLKKFKPIQAEVVARAMINAVKKNEQGFFRYTYEQIVPA